MPASPTKLSALTRPTCVVVIDDDPAVCQALQFYLELEGYVVRLFGDGESALAARLDSSRTCLVIDFRLPGMNGLQLLKALRAQQVTAPALLMTSQPDRNLREEAAKANMRIVEKPLLGDGLMSEIKAALAGQTPA